MHSKNVIRADTPGIWPLKETDPVVALLISDVHLSLRPPIARSAETEWLKVQAGYFRQLEEMLPAWDCPIVIAGDLFDKWSTGPELINYALSFLPEMYAIPGQHDLRQHALIDLKLTSFYTLCIAKKLTYIEPGFPVLLPLGSVDPGLILHGFPWGKPLEPCERAKWDARYPNALHLAIVHQYLWSDKSGGYPGAPVDCKLSKTRANLIGYDAAVFGDNHQPHLYPDVGNCHVLNHGCFIRRKADERKLQPGVGLLHASGRIKRRLLDVSDDKWLDAPDTDAGLARLAGIEEFVESLEQLGDESLDYPREVKRYMDQNQVGKRVRRQVLAALEAAAGG